MLEGLIVLAVLAVPAAAIAGFVMALDARGRLARLEQRLAGLEHRFAGAAQPLAADLGRPAENSTGRSAAEAGPAPAQGQTSADQPAPEPPEEMPVVPEPAVPEPVAVSPSGAIPPPAIGLEQRFGTRWVVWIGGLALALGGIFLVTYAVEQGFVGPGVRVTLAGLLAAALVAAGEWTRRRENLSGFAGIPTAHIPAIVTAAGTTVGYATVYGAFALYGFLPAPIAFLLLGFVALATLAAALLHGPALAGLGLVGAQAAPLLVASEEPCYWALYLYLAVVTAAAFALARLRLWRWLALTAIGFALFWGLAGLDSGLAATLKAQVFHEVVGFALAAALLVAGLAWGPPAAPGRLEPVSAIAIGAYLALAAVLTVASDHDAVALGAFTVLTVATLGVAWRSEAASAAVPAAAVLVVLVLGHWAVAVDLQSLIAPAGPVAGAVPGPQPAQTGGHLALGAGFAALFGLGGYLAQGRSSRPLIGMLWSASAVFAPVLILIALYLRIAGFERSIPFAGLALLLAALYGLATEKLDKRATEPGVAASTAIFATGAVAGLALALTLALDKGWLSIALALMVPGIAWIAEKRPLPALRWLAAGMVVIVGLRTAWDPRIVGDAVGATPIVNWLLYGYGVPAGAFWLAAHLLRRRGDDPPLRTVEAGALVFSVLLAVMEIRHLANDGDVYRPSGSLAEIGLQICVGLAMAIGLERLRQTTGSIVHNLGAMVLAGLSLAAIVFGLTVSNPRMTGVPVEPVFFNTILIGYGIPAALAAALALVTRHIRPRPYAIVAAITAVALALGYLTLQVTRLYHGADLASGPTTDAEQYTYSAVWLAFGVALLLAGIGLASLPVRLASAAVVALTIIKVFLIDMADLTGIYRALSFIGLGLVLMGIGWLYQRLLFPPAGPSAPAPSAPSPAVPT